MEKKLTFSKLTEEDSKYKAEMIDKVYRMYDVGYSFLLCWNFHQDVKASYDKAKRYDVKLITNAVRGIFQKDEYGKDVILVALEKGLATEKYVSKSAIDALKELGIVPIGTKISGYANIPSETFYKIAKPEEVVLFL